MLKWEHGFLLFLEKHTLTPLTLFIFCQPHYSSDSSSCLLADPLCLLYLDGCSVYKPIFVHVNFGFVVLDIIFHRDQLMFQASDNGLYPDSHIQHFSWVL